MVTEDDSVDKQKLAEIGDELIKKLEEAKIGKRWNEKLRISKKLPLTAEEEEKQEVQELLVLDQTQAILFSELKKRTSPMQLEKLSKLFHAYNRMDVSRDKLVGELPKILGGMNTSLETAIKKLVGVYVEPENRPENDRKWPVGKVLQRKRFLDKVPIPIMFRIDENGRFLSIAIDTFCLFSTILIS